MKKKLFSVFLLSIIILTFGVVILGNTVFGLDEATSRRYAINNIIFYNPHSCPEKYPLKAGGLSKSEAEEFMRVYRSAEGCAAELNINKMPSCHSVFANCVALSKYFVNRYTSKKVSSIGDGGVVVRTLASYGFPSGNTPRPYAIFSTANSDMMCGDSPCGHTGVVLGIDGNTVYTGEASCGNPLSAAVVKTKSMSEMTSGRYTFSYTDGLIEYGSENNE